MAPVEERPGPQTQLFAISQAGVQERVPTNAIAARSGQFLIHGFGGISLDGRGRGRPAS